MQNINHSRTAKALALFNLIYYYYFKFDKLASGCVT